LPDIGAADLEVGAGGATEDLQNFGGRGCLGGGVGKCQQQFLEGIVFGSVGVGLEYLFGSGGQKPPPQYARRTPGYKLLN
jgi:hypothetical protein